MTNEKCFEVHAELVVRPTGQDVDDIMVSALEGGICYWCDRVTVEGQYLGKYASEQISRGGTLKVHVTEPFDEQDTEWYELDIEKFIQGFRLWLENGRGLLRSCERRRQGGLPARLTRDVPTR